MCPNIVCMTAYTVASNRHSSTVFSQISPGCKEGRWSVRWSCWLSSRVLDRSSDSGIALSRAMTARFAVAVWNPKVIAEMLCRILGSADRANPRRYWSPLATSLANTIGLSSRATRFAVNNTIGGSYQCPVAVASDRADAGCRRRTISDSGHDSPWCISKTKADWRDVATIDDVREGVTVCHDRATSAESGLGQWASWSLLSF